MEGSGHVPESVARMQAKAAQLAEELRLAQAGSQSLTISSSTAVGAEAAHGAAWCTSTACSAGSLLQHAGGAPPTPAVFRRLSQANLAAMKQPGATADAQQLTTVHCQKLEAELQLWKCKHADALKELDRRQDSYMRREEQLKLQLAALIQPQEAADSSSTRSSDGSNGNSSSGGQSSDAAATDGSQPAASSSSRVQKVQKQLTLQDMQEQVLNGLDDLLQRQKLQMRTEEAQQLRQFRSRLAEIEGQLQACRQAAAAHQGDWMDKTVALREELARTQEIASKLDAMYKLAEEEAAQYRVQFKAQEDDRQHLVRQLIAVKQENSRLRQEQSALQEELDAIIALALEAEAGRPEVVMPADTADLSLWGSTALHAAGARPSTSDSSLAAAINDVVSSVQSGGSACGRVRPMTAGSGRQRSTAAVQQVRPWSAAAPKQHGHVRSSTEVGEQGVPSDAAAVQAKMERYSHVIQQLKKLLESERRQLRHARSSYTAELSRRTELQGLLLSSIQHAKQQHRAAEAAASAQPRQSIQTHPWADERPRSTAAGMSRSRPVSCRPMTSGHTSNAAAVGSSQLLGSGRQQSSSRPSSALQPARLLDGHQCAQFDQGCWDQLLEQLLVRRDVLELLFNRAFPDFMAEVPQQQGQAGSSSSSQQGPEAQQLFERWAACQQQQQLEQQQLHQHQEPQQYGLGETSPPDTELSGVLLDEGLEASDSDGGSCHSSGMDRGNRGARAAGAECAASRGAGVETAAEDATDGAAVAWDEQQQQQQEEEESSIQQQAPENGHLTLGGLSAPVMPRFPARQPLHHTVVRRPRSGIVQHQADTEGAPRRPASAAAGSQSVQQHRSHSPARPATAASRQAGGLGQQQQQQQQQRLLGQSFAAGSAIAGACQRPGSSNSCSSRIGGGPAQVGRPPSAGSKHVWAADAASIAGSFLASN